MRDSFASCPRCMVALDDGDRRLECARCQGVLIVDPGLFDLISEAQIQSLMTATRNDPWQREEFARGLTLEAPRAIGSSLQCPRCAALMTQHTLYGVQVDRCEGHGVWLDGDHELRLVLANAASRI